MLSIIFWVVVGLVVGWHVPQPSWIKKAEDKAVDSAKKVLKK
jgi:hypothetical protein